MAETSAANLTADHVAELNTLIEPDNRENRHALKEVLKDPLFDRDWLLFLPEQRKTALIQLQKIVNAETSAGKRILSVMDFETNPLNIFMTHEVVAAVDFSVATKMTVQFNLFGGTILKLGSDEQRTALAPGIDTLKDIGCFALTELGYGNNAVDMETTAHYDPKTNEIVVNTPSTVAQKYWITNSADHAHHAIVFAQLYVDGKCEGIHGILVPIRDKKTMQAMPGVIIEDMGLKMGCNGVDNGKLWFRNVRVPAEALLSQYSQIDSAGRYQTSIKGGARDRFLKVADQLLSGRLCLSSMGIGGWKCSMKIALNFSKTRLAVGPTGKSDTPLIKYQIQQDTIVPRLAKLYAAIFGLAYVKKRWADTRPFDRTVGPSNDHEVLILCCVIKPLIAWWVLDSANIFRERAGGQGYIAVNRFGDFIGGTHALVTAEGDSSVLMQKVSKELLSAARNGKVSLEMFETTLEGREIKWNSIDFLEKLLKHRFSRQLTDLASKLQAKVSEGKKLFNVWMFELSREIQSTARSFGEHMCMEQFVNVVKNAKSEASRKILGDMCKTYAMDIILGDIGWYAMDGTIPKDHLLQISSIHSECVSSIIPNISAAVDALGIPDEFLRAPMAQDWVKFNEPR